MGKREKVHSNGIMYIGKRESEFKKLRELLGNSGAFNNGEYFRHEEINPLEEKTFPKVIVYNVSPERGPGFLPYARTSNIPTIGLLGEDLERGEFRRLYGSIGRYLPSLLCVSSQTLAYEVCEIHKPVDSIDDRGRFDRIDLFAHMLDLDVAITPNLDAVASIIREELSR